MDEVIDALRQRTIQKAFLDAVKAGRVEEARELLAAGAAVDAAVDSGRPALLIAAADGNREMVEFLLDAGADVNQRGLGGESALSRAYRHEQPAVATLLLERGAKPEGHLLLRAVEENRTGWIDLLLRFGAPVDATALVSRIRRAFHDAPDEPETAALADRVLDLLLADEGWRRVEWDLLALTACRTDPSLARRLVDRGADLSRRNPAGVPPRKGWTLLHEAVASDRPECVDRLLEWGADVNTASPTGLSPLMVALHPQNLPLAHRLLRAGANPRARTDAGRTPLLLLAEAPVTRDPDRRDRFVADHLALADLLIDAGADVDARDDSGENALLAAASEGKLWLVEHLLDRGAELTAETWETMAALHGDGWRIGLERMWRDRDLPLPSLVELFPPRPAPTVDARAQLRTMQVFHRVGQALTSWLVDSVGAAAAATPSSWSVHDYQPVSVGELEKLLTPYYLPWIPVEDGWGHPIEYRVNRQGLLSARVFLLRSPGRDGRYSADEYEPGVFPASRYDEDIVFADGRFLRAPGGPEEGSANIRRP